MLADAIEIERLREGRRKLALQLFLAGQNHHWLVERGYHEAAIALSNLITGAITAISGDDLQQIEAYYRVGEAH